jgi:hypothetical protein
MPAKHDVPCGITKRTPHPRAYFGKNANELHSDLARRQSFGRTFTLRLDEGANHIPSPVEFLTG